MRRLLRAAPGLVVVVAFACSGTDPSHATIDDTATEPGATGASGGPPAAGTTPTPPPPSSTTKDGGGTSGDGGSGDAGAADATGGGPLDASLDAAAPKDAAPPDPCDLDGDGFRAASCAGGTDCDDADPLIHPGAAESDDWSVETIDFDAHACPTCAVGAQLAAWRFWDVALALAPDGTARIAMVWNDPSSAKVVLYTETPAGNFTSEVIAPLDATSKTSTSIAVDSAGKVHLAWIRGPLASPTNAGTLRYATNASGTWTQTDVDELWDGFAPYGFYVEPSGAAAHFAYVPKRPAAAATLEHTTRLASGTMTHELVDARIPSQIALAHDGTRLRMLFLAGGFYAADANAAAPGWVVNPVAAAGQPGRSVVAAAGAPGVIHAAHFDETTGGLMWTGGTTLALSTVPILDLDAKVAQKPGIAVRAMRTDYLMNAKPPGWNIPFVVQVAQKGGVWTSERFDSIGDCTTERCRLPLVARSDGALRGAAIGHFLNGATKKWEDHLRFYRRSVTDGIDRACNGE